MKKVTLKFKSTSSTRFVLEEIPFKHIYEFHIDMITHYRIGYMNNINTHIEHQLTYKQRSIGILVYLITP
jgi:hypothetical protein